MSTRPATTHESTDVSKNIDDILAGYMSEPEDVSVITSAPQDVGPCSCSGSVYKNALPIFSVVFFVASQKSSSSSYKMRAYIIPFVVHQSSTPLPFCQFYDTVYETVQTSRVAATKIEIVNCFRYCNKQCCKVLCNI